MKFYCLDRVPFETDVEQGIKYTESSRYCHAMSIHGIKNETNTEGISFMHRRCCMGDDGFFKADLLLYPLLSVWKSNIVNGQERMSSQLMDTAICVQELCACLGIQIS